MSPGDFGVATAANGVVPGVVHSRMNDLIDSKASYTLAHFSQRILCVDKFHSRV